MLTCNVLSIAGPGEYARNPLYTGGEVTGPAGEREGQSGENTHQKPQETHKGWLHRPST